LGYLGCGRLYRHEKYIKLDQITVNYSLFESMECHTKVVWESNAKSDLN